MSVKTMPLSEKSLGHHTPSDFFATVLLARTPSGKFYVYGRFYIAQATPPGTLVLFHFGGRVVAHARLQQNWKQPNDGASGHEAAVGIYLFQDIVALSQPVAVADLPDAWQTSWPLGRFDQQPRTLDAAHEAAFLAIAR